MEPGAQFVQLPMFAKARDLRDINGPGHGDMQNLRFHDPKDLWEHKFNEAHEYVADEFEGQRPLDIPEESSLAESIVKHGVQRPILLEDPAKVPDHAENPRLLDGHHSTAVAAEYAPESLVAIQHNYFSPNKPMTPRQVAAVIKNER
jgi:hypothetical protein